MSAPTKQLGKLSIGGRMPTTRAQRLSEEQSESSSDEEVSGSEDDEIGAAVPLAIHGSSSIAYDLRELSRSSRARAYAGLTGEFVVDKCKTTPSGFDFQVSDHGRVHLGQGPLTCSCEDFEERGRACRHVFWLVDQLHRLVLPKKPAPGVPLSEAGESPQFAPMYKLIGDNMEDLAKRVEWPYIPGAGSPSARMTRPEKARDIISAFSETTMPEEFRPDLVEAIAEPRTPEQCLLQGDFEGTMFRLAVHDDDVFTSLRKVMPSGARAAIFFDKIQRRSQSLLADFDRYRQTGTPRSDGTALEIPVVIDELYDNIRQIRKNIFSRAPHGSKGAAEALITLLREISNRNFDAYDGQNWRRRPRSGETTHDRNLYVQLIGQPSQEPRRPESMFVLDVLEILPIEILEQWEPQLKTIFENVQNHGATMAYFAKLQSLANLEHQPVMTTTGAGGSGQKRPAAGSSGSGRKRTK